MMLVTVANTPNIIKEPVSQQAELKKEIKKETSVEEATTTEKAVVIDITNATSTSDIKKITLEFFKNTPILAEIARCESEFRQYGTDGPLRGRVNSKDVGVMQINERYHSARSKQLGMDIHTLEGNLKYGALLYQEQGSQPWSASRSCWSKASATLATNL
jgi:hypothetical protein